MIILYELQEAGKFTLSDREYLWNLQIKGVIKGPKNFTELKHKVHNCVGFYFVCYVLLFLDSAD